MRIASVVLDIPTQSLDCAYYYRVPEKPSYAPATLFDEITPDTSTELEVSVGCAVIVPFGPRKVIGFVLELWDTTTQQQLPDDIHLDKLKDIEQSVSKPFFTPEGAQCAQWIAQRYIAPLAACVRLFIPPGGVPKIERDELGGYRLIEATTTEVDDRWIVPGPAFADYTPRKKSPKQEAILNALRSGGEVRVIELTAQVGAIASALSTLEKKDVITIEHRRRMRSVEGSQCTHAHYTIGEKPQLNEEQAQAVACINHATQRACGEVVLVDGVTGSGKTEVYLQAIEAVLTKGKTACVLVPEISLTPQTVGRFRQRFGDSVAVIHSKMSPGERYDQWDFIRSGDARVVVGARSALFTPLQNVGLYIIDEEHEGSYKQDNQPRYHARDVAAWLAQQNHATLVLGSATPSIEALYACNHNPQWHHVVLSQRANRRPLPEIIVVDMAKEFGGGSRSMFSYDLTRALQAELSAGHKAILLLNQRGFAKFILCRECGFVPECPSCSTSLTYHEVGNQLICHHCGYITSAPTTCPVCGSPYLKKFGAGTQRVEAELRILLDELEGVGADVPIIRMDADTTTHKGAHQQLLETFAAAERAVLLGTQMIAKGLDFDDVTLVGVINADTTLHVPDYRASERTFDLIEQVAGRAGRAELPGRVFVQTYEASSLAIRAAATYDREAFLSDELIRRRMLSYPPYVTLANILIWGKDEAAVKQEAERVYRAVRDSVQASDVAGWSVLPATSCVLSKLRNTYRWHVLVRCPTDQDPATILLPFIRSRKTNPLVSVAVDVDPMDLL